jgi:hypothetical protein
MGKSPGVQAHQLSASQRSTIRRTVQDAIARHDLEWAMRNTCIELEEKYGVSRDTIEYLLHDELPSALPEELLSAGQKHRLRREFDKANSLSDSKQQQRAVAAVFKRFEDLPLLALPVEALRGGGSLPGGGRESPLARPGRRMATRLMARPNAGIWLKLARTATH